MKPLNERITTLCDSGYESKIATFVDSLEKVHILPQELQDKLAKLGSTPIDEPDVYSAILKSDEEGQAVVALQVLSEDEIKQYSAVEIGNFIYAVKKHISDLQLLDGTFKSTINTVDCKLPNFLQGDKLQQMAKKQQQFLNTLTDTATDKFKAKAVKEFEAMLTAFNDYAIEVSGLDKESLSDWEKALVISQVVGTTTNAFLCATGKGLGN